MTSPLAPSNPVGDLTKALDPNAGNITGKQGTLSEWAGPFVADLLGKVKALSSDPYQVYGGPLTAGASDLQNKLFQGLGGLAFPSQLGKSFTDQGVMESYMNPYMQQVLAPQMQALQRQADTQRNVLGANAAKSGAFGGARAGLMGSQLNADLMRQQQQVTGKAYQDAFTQGLGQFNTEQGQARELANLLGTAGGTQRGIEAEGIAADKAEFEQQRAHPYAMLQFENSMLQGLPIQSVATSIQQPSTASNIANIAGTLMGIYEKYFPNTATGTTTGTPPIVPSGTETTTKP